MSETYQCQANLSGSENPKHNYRQGQLLSEVEFDALPEKMKFKFIKLSMYPQKLSDTDVRKILFDLRERVEVLESKLSKNK